MSVFWAGFVRLWQEGNAVRIAKLRVKRAKAEAKAERYRARTEASLDRRIGRKR